MVVFIAVLAERNLIPAILSVYFTKTLMDIAASRE